MNKIRVLTRSMLFILLFNSISLTPRLAQAEPGNQNPTTFKDAQYFVKEAGKDKAEPVKGDLSFDSAAKAVRFAGKQTKLDIPYDQITSLTYEKTSKPRYALGLLVAWPLLFTKSKGHYLTIQYKQPGGEGQFALIRLDKNNFQMALATAEAQTGKKVERVEEK